jgi:hypothetical protein
MIDRKLYDLVKNFVYSSVKRVATFADWPINIGALFDEQLYVNETFACGAAY